jgi:adenosylcobinamide kinase/adenosylcobinamide-phosphate guanylyltransferase
MIVISYWIILTHHNFCNVPWRSIMKQLILGGARSGKSSLAEQLAQASGKNVIYFATANTDESDTEMSARIAQHQQQRPESWPTIEAPLKLAYQLQQQTSDKHCLLVDCLTLWLSNCLFHSDKIFWSKQKQALLDTVPTLAGDIIFVSNEVGSGVVPLGEINRRFVDESGFLHQALAAQCDRVILTAAGLPLILKGDAL